MESDQLPRKLTAILYADVAGYSRLTGEDEEGTHRLLSEYLDLLSSAIEQHRGRVVHYAGDAVLADFDTATDAMSCASSTQAALQSRNDELPEERKVQFRIGVNLGEVIVDRDDIYGDGVNVAARLESLAEPGGICISESVRSAVGRKLPLAYEFTGEREVKNIAEAVRTYRVVPAVDSGQPAAALPPCPYPGMVPFQADDARFFYGRDAEIKQMVQLLRRQRFLMVIGPSGSGKSSLVYAGLLPELGKSRYFAEGFWLIRRMRPGPRPIETLAELLETPSDGARFEYDTVQALLTAHPPAQRLLLLVDQFEEVFTQASREEGARFIAALQALRTPENCALLLTLRADFYPDLMTSYLWPVDASQRVEVAPLRGEALREAIQRPAVDVGVRLEESLVDRLLADAADEPGALPLLQETMGLLWEEIERRVLPYQAYEKLSSDVSAHSGEGPASGLAVAIAMKADTTLAELSLLQQTIARRIFLRLIQFGEGRADTRRQQPMSALLAAGDEPAEFARTLEHLTDHRLLTRSGGDEGGGSAVDIAHESLITGWSRLQAWADERREAEQVRRRLEGKAAEWVRLGRGSGGLLDEAELPEAERWLASPDAADLGYDAALPALVQASQQAIEEAERAQEAARQRELTQAQALAEEQANAARRMRRSLMGLAAVFLVAVGAALLAWFQGQKAQTLAAQEATARQAAETRRVEAETARVEAERARLSSIAQLLLIQAPQQQAIDLDERGALLARQAHLFSAAGGRGLKEQVDSVLRTVVGKPNFSAILSPLNAESVAFSADGMTLVSTHITTAEVLLWDLARPRALPTRLPGYPGDTVNDVPNGRLYALAISPDGKTLVAGNEDGAMARWDLEHPDTPPVALDRQEAGIWSVAFSEDGRWLAVGSKQDDTFRLWDLADPGADPVAVRDPQAPASIRGPPMGPPGGVPVAFSPDNKILASGGLDGTIRLWDPTDPTTPVNRLRGHDDAVWSVSFSPDGKTLVSGGEDATVRLWNLHDQNAPPVVLTGHGNPVYSVAFSPDGESLVAAGRPDIRLWDSDSPDTPAVVLRGSFNKVTFSPDGAGLASAGQAESALRLWDLTPTGQPAVLTGHRGSVLSVAFAPDGGTLASGGGSSDKTIRLWNLADSNAPPAVLRGHEGYVSSVAFSPDGKLLSSASVDNTVRLWQLGDTNMEMAVLTPPEPWLATFSPDGKTLASGSVGGDAYLWDVADPGAEPEVLRLAKNWIAEIALSPDGAILAVAGDDPVIYLQDLANPGTAASELRGHESTVWSLAFSPGGKTLASAGHDTTVRLWDVSKPGAPSTVLGRHDDEVRTVRFSPDGKRLATGSKDTSVRLWDVEDLNAVPALLHGHEGGIWRVAFSPDGKTLASASADATIRLWDLTHPLVQSTSAGLADLVCEKVWRNITLDEWYRFVGEDIPYERTCPNLPVHPSVIEGAGKRAKAGDVGVAIALFERAAEDLNPDPEAEAERLANPASQ